jgi:AcrR family transcriptional regulator
MVTENPRENVRQKKEALYRSVILEAAEHELAEHGYEAVRIQDIAARAGISVGTLYAVFPGKWEIYVAVHTHHVGALIALGAEIVGRTRHALTALREGSVLYTRYLADHPSYLRMHLREGYAWSSSSQFRSAEQVEAWNRGIELIAALFRQAINDGDVHEGDPVLFAKLMVGMQQVQLAAWFDSAMVAAKDELTASIVTIFDRTFALPARINEGER